ncbi:MAG TPA: hypothetical protein DCE56_35225 [Cyanobacteria bacterium UBA8553]|nr:hypothetical protein [Cyanobacteria bacterium UBA8553]
MNKKKLSFLVSVKTGFVASVLLLGVMGAPAHAAPSGSNSDPISSLTDWFNNQLKAVQGYADKFSETIGSLGDEFKGITDGLMGDLGLADSTKAREKSKDASLDSNSPEYKGETAANEVDRQNATASSEAVLSEDGQKQQAKAYDQTQTSVENNQQYAEQAQGDEVTQNVMKRIASQTAETSNVLGGLRADSLKQTEQGAQTNKQLTNLSRTVDGQTQQSNYQAIGGGYSNLRTASQASLF